MGFLVKFGVCGQEGVCVLLLPEAEVLGSGCAAFHDSRHPEFGQLL